MTLYRQYRPLQFQDLIGQDSVARTLQNALLQGRVAHAYLLSGPRGTGKTTTARIFARALTCLNPKKGKEGFEPCNACEHCQSILEGRAQDLIEIDAASNRGIEDIRSLREQAQYPPLQLSHKVYIIDEVHMLTGEAFNALLKTLEEPPKHCIFILATTELHKLPATIRSRCQVLRFERGSVAAITKKLSDVAKSEGLEIEPAALKLIAEHADGGFRDALTLLEHAITRYPQLTHAQTIDVLGIGEEQSVNELLELITSGKSTEALRHLRETIAPSGAKMERVLAQLIDLTRQRLADAPARYGQLLEGLLEAYILQKSSPHPLLPLEVVICENSATPAERPVAHATTLPKVARIEPAPAEPASAVPVVEIRDALIKDIRRAWKQAGEEIARTNLPLGQMLRESLLHTAEGDLVTVQVRYKFHLEKLSEKKNRATVESVLAELCGKKWQVTYELGENIPKRPPRKGLSDSAASDAAAVFGNNEK